MNQADPVDEKYLMWWKKHFTETERGLKPKLTVTLPDSEEFSNLQESINREVLKFKPESAARYIALTDLLEKNVEVFKFLQSERLIS